jgi:hypothetical protein
MGGDGGEKNKDYKLDVLNMDRGLPLDMLFPTHNIFV